MIRLGRGLRCLHTRMSRERLPPGVYLQVAPLSTQASQEHLDLSSNPMFIKYAEKIKHLKESDPALYEERMEKLRALYTPPPPEVPEEGSSVDPEDCPAQTKTQTLDSIMRVELLQDKSAEEIEELWKEYHRDKPCVFAAIPAPEFTEIHKRSKDFPAFLYPVARNQGYEFFVQQFDGLSCHFTPLGSFQGGSLEPLMVQFTREKSRKVHKENAPSCLTLQHYTDLMDSKGLVLMRGEPDRNILSVYEAQLLSLQLKIYYGLHSGLKFNLVRQFNNSPDSFRYMDLIKEFENYKRDSKDFTTEYKQS